MKNWIKKRFDNKPPRYGFLSNAQESVIVIGLVFGLVMLPIGFFFSPTSLIFPFLGLFFFTSSLIVIAYM